MPEETLEPLAPQAALDWYVEHRQDELRTSTRRKHQSALGTFVEWTDRVGLDDMTDLTGRRLVEFKTWRKSESDLSTVSLNGNLAILQRFLRFCETVEAVPEGFAEKVPLPNVPPEEEVDDWVPADSAVENIQSYFRQFEYASRRHVMFELISEVGLRLGAVRAIDLRDVECEELVVRLRHRPEDSEAYGTPLKNGPDGERLVNVSEQLGEFIEDYIEHTRVETMDRYGREPLFTTPSGRPSTTTIRRDFYKMTRSCVSTGDCPHGREVSDCEATMNANAADCPGRFSTHPLRKWAIMNQLDAGVPKELLSDRVDVSVPVLDKHYDQRSEERKSQRRREVLEVSLDTYATDGGCSGK
jgi:site-specific recombinase XerD